MKKNLQFLSLLAVAVLFSVSAYAQYPKTLLEDDFEDPDMYEFGIGSWGTEEVATGGVDGSVGVQMGGDPVGGCGFWSNAGVAIEAGHVYKASIMVKSMGAEGDVVAPVIFKLSGIVNEPNIELDKTNPDYGEHDWPANAYQGPGNANITTEWQESVIYVKADLTGDTYPTIWSFSGYGQWNISRPDWGVDAYDALVVVDDFKFEDMGTDFVIPSYTVTFVDADCNVLATEVVAHGDAATAPEGVDEWNLIFSSVTSDMTVSPKGGDCPTAVEFIPYVSEAAYIAGDELKNVDGEVKVYDISGRLILQREAAGTLNVSSLLRGIYIVRVGYNVTKVIKQ